MAQIDGTDCGLLYHHTTEEGLAGIIRNDNIRATHVRFLNDWAEFREAVQEKYVRWLASAPDARLRNAIAHDVHRLTKTQHFKLLSVSKLELLH